MAYCRFSSENFRCDVYVYSSVYGYTTHVASNRVLGDIPEVPSPLIDIDSFLQAHQAQHAFLETASREPIGLTRDGESFDDPDLESLIERLISLRDEGYNVPSWVFDILAEELAEEANLDPSPGP